ncbi:MAG: hypothetical protein AB1752_14695 [Candidatus Zixiibacteriota bacterium]
MMGFQEITTGAVRGRARLSIEVGDGSSYTIDIANTPRAHLAVALFDLARLLSDQPDSKLRGNVRILMGCIHQLEK